MRPPARVPNSSPGDALSSAGVGDSSAGGLSSAGVENSSAGGVGVCLSHTDFETVAAERVLALLQEPQSLQTESAISLASAASDFFFRLRSDPYLESSLPSSAEQKRAALVWLEAHKVDTSLKLVRSWFVDEMPVEMVETFLTVERLVRDDRRGQERLRKYELSLLGPTASVASKREAWCKPIPPSNLTDVAAPPTGPSWPSARKRKAEELEGQESVKSHIEPRGAVLVEALWRIVEFYPIVLW